MIPDTCANCPDIRFTERNGYWCGSADNQSYIIGSIHAIPPKECPRRSKACSKCGREIAPDKRITVPGKEGLCYDCYKAGPKIICVDLDGVLAQYSGWQGPDHIGDPLPGAREFLDSLNDMGYEIVIFSTRSPAAVIAWVQKYDLARNYFVGARNEKLPATAYVDDRAICFRGDFSETLMQLKYFKPYWKENK